MKNQKIKQKTRKEQQQQQQYYDFGILVLNEHVYILIVMLSAIRTIITKHNKTKSHTINGKAHIRDERQRTK